MNKTKQETAATHEAQQDRARVTVYSGPKEPMPWTRDVCEKQIAMGQEPAGEKGCQPDVLAIYPGGGRMAKAAQEHSQNYKYSGSSRRAFTTVGSSSKLDLTSNEGREHLRDIAKANQGKVITFAYDGCRLESARLPVALTSMQQIAREFNVHIIVFAHDCASARSELEEYADEFIEVLACEADPDALAAFAISHGESRLNFGMGHYRVMWQVKEGEDGKFKRRCTPFIHQEVAMRFQHELREHNYTLKAISEMFGSSDPSKSYRHLGKMPPVKKSKKPIDEERFALFAEFLALKVPSVVPEVDIERTKSSAVPDASDETEDDDEGDADAVVLPPKKAPAAKKKSRPASKKVVKKG